MRIGNRFAGGDKGELRRLIAIAFFAIQAPVEIFHFAAGAVTQAGGVELLYFVYAALARDEVVPERRHIVAQRANRAHSRDDYSRHGLFLSCNRLRVVDYLEWYFYFFLRPCIINLPLIIEEPGN